MNSLNRHPIKTLLLVLWHVVYIFVFLLAFCPYTVFDTHMRMFQFVRQIEFYFEIAYFLASVPRSAVRSRKPYSSFLAIVSLREPCSLEEESENQYFPSEAIKRYSLVFLSWNHSIFSNFIFFTRWKFRFHFSPHNRKIQNQLTISHLPSTCGGWAAFYLCSLRGGCYWCNSC